MGEYEKRSQRVDESIAKDTAPAARDPSDHSAKQPRPEERCRNYAVKKFVIRSLLAVMIVLLTMILYILWFTTGQPEPTTDYVALLNEMTRPEGLTSDNNAWPHYERAIQLYSPYRSTLLTDHISGGRTRWFDDFNEPAQRAVVEWIEDNEAAWQEFVQGAEKPCLWRQYRVLPAPDSTVGPDTPVLNLDVRHRVPLTMLRFQAIWRIRWEAHVGQTTAALHDCLVLMRAGAQWSNTGSLGDSIGGVGMAMTGHQEFLNVLARTSVDEIDWQALETDLAQTYSTGTPAIRMEQEKLMSLDLIQHTFTRVGLGGGHLIPRYVWSFVQSHGIVITIAPLPKEPGWRQRGLYLAMSLAHARRDATIAECHSRYDRITQILALTPYELSRSEIPITDDRLNVFNFKIRFDSFFSETRYFMVDLSTEVAQRMSEKRWQWYAWQNTTRAILAIRRWQSEHGQYPETLEQLTGAGRLEPPPLDPYSDTTLVYHRTKDGFTLYSRGRNMRDDGGVSHIDPKSPWRIWGTKEAGDTVFWPIR